MAGNKVPKLHEIIAVKSNLKSQAAKCMGDLVRTFTGKHQHFTGRIKSYHPDADGQPVEQSEQLEIQTTVRAELEWLAPYLARAYDINMRAALGDRLAQADIMLEETEPGKGGRVLATGVPVTVLLDLEDRMEELRGLVQAIPTLDPAKGFQADPEKGEGIYKARTVEKIRTAAVKKVIQLAAATKEHKEQAQLVDLQERIGVYRENEWSSMFTSGEKADMLDRLEMVSRAIKAARMEANGQEVEARPRIGAEILNYVLGVPVAAQPRERR